MRPLRIHKRLSFCN